MKPLHLYIQSTTWQRKVVLIAMYHNFHKMKDNNWKLVNTASYFHVSIGLVSENLRLFKNYELVKECKTRKDALELIK